MEGGGFRVQGSGHGFRVQGRVSGFRVGSEKGFGVQGFRVGVKTS